MTKHMPFPADVNPDPDAKYSRGTAEAFPFDPQLTPALERFPVPNRPGFWLIAALLVLISLAMSGCSGATAQDSTKPAQALNVSQAARDAFACPGMHADWLNETTVRCLKERP